MLFSPFIQRLQTIFKSIPMPSLSGLSTLLELSRPKKTSVEQPIPALPASEPKASSTDLIEKEPVMSLASIEAAITSITAVAEAISDAVAVLSTSTSISVAWTDIKMLYTATASLMQQVEATVADAATKKAKVLAVIQLLASKLNLNWANVAAIVNDWIDTIKTAYNAVVSAVAPVKAAVVQAASSVAAAV